MPPEISIQCAPKKCTQQFPPHQKQCLRLHANKSNDPDPTQASTSGGRASTHAPCAQPPIPRPATLDWRPSSPKFWSAAAAPRRPCRAARCSQLRIAPATPPSSASGHVPATPRPCRRAPATPSPRLSYSAAGVQGRPACRAPRPSWAVRGGPSGQYSINLECNAMNNHS